MVDGLWAIVMVVLPAATGADQSGGTTFWDAEANIIQCLYSIFISKRNIVKHYFPACP